MSRRAGTAGRATRKPVVVLAGEDANDRDTLRTVLEAMCPEMRGRLVEIRDSVRLREATGQVLRDRLSVLYWKALARARREDAELACLFIHEDWDGVDGQGRDSAYQRVERELLALSSRAHYVLATWEVEAWLLLFPRAVVRVLGGRVPGSYRGRDTGLLTNPKKLLKREFRAGREYQESDSAQILQAAADVGCIANPVGQNGSWKQLQEHVRLCCARHLPNV